MRSPISSISIEAQMILDEWTALMSRPRTVSSQDLREFWEDVNCQCHTLAIDQAREEIRGLLRWTTTSSYN